MPNIALRYSDASEATFSPSQYMFYPSVSVYTKETVCALGLFDRILYDYERYMYVLGQVFMVNYPVFIEITASS